MKTEDKMMKEFLEEELEKEAADIKKEIEQNPELCDGEPDPDLKNKIWQKARELQRQKEAYQNLSEADKEALRLGKELQLRREEKENEEISEELMPETARLAAGAEEDLPENPVQEENSGKTVHIKRRRKKTIVALAVALVAVLGLGITSFGDQGYVTETVNRILGGRKTTNITSEDNKDEATQQEEIEEEEVFQKIKDEFGFDAVRLDYKPQDMIMIDSLIDETLQTANVYYQCNENAITYIIAWAYQDFSFGYDMEDTIVEEYEKKVKDVDIHVTEYQVLEINEHQFSASFQYDDVSYFLTGIIEKEEFEKILENLHFF